MGRDRVWRPSDRGVRLRRDTEISVRGDSVRCCPSADAAAAVGAELGEIAKSILFDVDGESVLVIASGDRRISELKLVAWFNGASAQIANRAEVHDRTGFVVGGTPAVGLRNSVRILADADLARYRWVWSAGGTPDTVYPVALERLVAASGARWADVTDRGK